VNENQGAGLPPITQKKLVGRTWKRKARGEEKTGTFQQGGNRLHKKTRSDEEDPEEVIKTSRWVNDLEKRGKGKEPAG